jgi:hypothetical protein
MSIDSKLGVSRKRSSHASHLQVATRWFNEGPAALVRANRVSDTDLMVTGSRHRLHPGTRVLNLSQAWALAHEKNVAQYGETMALEGQAT